MPVTLTKEPEGRTPVGGRSVAVQLRCDHCGEDLLPDEDDVAAWEPDDRVRYLDVVFLHRACVAGHRGLGADDRSGPIRDLETADLGPFLATLIHNLEVAG